MNETKKKMGEIIAKLETYKQRNQSLLARYDKALDDGSLTAESACKYVREMLQIQRSTLEAVSQFKKLVYEEGTCD